MPLYDKPSSLWAFTVERYTRPGVQHAAITLQEQLGADVNLLFYCVWHAASDRGLLSEIEFVEIEARIARWRDEVTVPLRRLRNNIKHHPGLAGLSGAMETRKLILDAEIDSERAAQIAIESVAGPPGPPETNSLREIAESNLRAYLQYIGATINADTERHLDVYLNGVLSHN